MPHAFHEISLPPYTRELVYQAMDRSGYPLVLEEHDVCEFDSQIQMARPGSPVHTLVVSRPYRDHTDHFLASAAYKIIRFYEQPPEERYLPTSDAGSGMPEPERRELRRKEPWSRLPTAEFEAMADFLYRGTVRQLTSYPVDLRVEREIAEELPEHQGKQRAYLERQVRDFEPTFEWELADAFPESVGRASQAMNVAFAEEAAELTGTSPGRLCLEAQYRPLGERLRDHLQSTQEHGYPGDRLVTDRWAEELGLRDWYEWRRVDSV